MRFYLDVKENQRGRFIKIAEISADGRKNQILMTFSTAALFSQNLVTFIDFYRDLDKLDPDNLRQGELKSEVMYKDDKKYHMDLKENARGRFLKVSETFTRGYSRFQFSSQLMVWPSSSIIWVNSSMSTIMVTLKRHFLLLKTNM